MLNINIGGQDVTLVADQYTFSNVARGGFEQSQISLTYNLAIERGDEVMIFEGTEIAWHGFVDSPGDVAKDGKHRTGIVALGYGAKLKSDYGMMTFIDADLNSWTGPTAGRQYDLVSALYAPVSPEVATDGGIPALRMTLTGAWGLSGKAICEATYDNAGMQIAQVLSTVTWGVNASNHDTDPNWVLSAYMGFSSRFNTGLEIATAGLENVAGSTYNWSFSNSDPVNTCAMFQMFYSAAGGTDGVLYESYHYPVVIGAHGLPIHSKAYFGAFTPTRYSVRPHDVARWAIQQADLNCNYVSEVASYDIVDLKYKSPTPLETIVADAANFMGWMWGTWEPTSLFSRTPTFLFQAPPSTATCEIAKADCEDIDEPVISLSNSYNRAIVNFHDAAGSNKYVTVRSDNPVLEPLGEIRELSLSMGIADADAATTYGAFALELSQASQRGGGSVTTSSTLKTPGGTKPATLVRAGRDRIRIPDLNDGNIYLQDSRAADTFLVERVETTVTGGKASTRIEFDTGGDLLEVINARMTSEFTAANVQ